MRGGVRVIVCGGRDYADQDRAWHQLEMFHNSEGRITALAHGGAKGADEIAGRWGEAEHIPVRVFPANWKRDGKAAGPLRNQRMLDEFKPDVVIAFAGGRGTSDMVRRAEAEGVRVVRMEK
jgi:hypothetical protein